MREKRIAALVLFGALLLALVAGPVLAQGGVAATAELRTSEDEAVGTAEFVETSEGVAIDVEITGNVPPGTHGLHIHEKADLSDPAFESAGDHFNPTGAEHGFDNPNGPHAGDLENIPVADDGTAGYEYVNDRITLSAGPDSILDDDGSALIVHAMTDDYRTDDDPESGPGMSGDRVAAGVIEVAESVPDTGGVGVLPMAALLLLAGAGIFSLAMRRA
ncbi:MAG: superoxide dismutase family protein [Actinomycetota bacterium]|nr:superoxide dismutase family protein [Actinomycetota bacterium]